MTIDIGVSTLFCLHKPFNEALKEMMLFGMRCVELTDEGLHALSKARVELLLELKASYDLRYALHAPFADVNIAAYDDFIREAVLKRLEASIRWASALEVEVMVYHPGSISVLEHRYPGKAWELNLEAVLRLQKYAHEHGVSAMIENVPDPFPFIMKSVENFDRFYDEVDIDVRMVLDIAHANIRGETEEFLRRFHDKIGHIHVSDNKGRVDEHLRLGEGSIDWEVVMTKVKDSGFQGWIVVESFEGVDESLRLLGGLMDRY
jgi:sugar phosphate isomerase/epimerase